MRGYQKGRAEGFGVVCVLEVQLIELVAVVVSGLIVCLESTVVAFTGEHACRRITRGTGFAFWPSSAWGFCARGARPVAEGCVLLLMRRRRDVDLGAMAGAAL